MLEYLLLVFGFFSGVWFLRSFRNELYKLARNTLSLLDALLDDVEEEIKVQRVQRSTFPVLISLLTAAIVIAVALAVSLFPYWLYTSRIYGYGYVVPTGLWQIVAISIGASIPFFIPLKKDENGYSEISQLLHYLILDNYAIGLKLFKRELKQRKKLDIKTKSKFVIVTGLARSGTTSLMNHLASIKELRSLSYANMPLLLAPNTWSRFYKPKSAKLKERSHKDGIKIGLESNEALEEYFFKAIVKDEFIKEKELVNHKLSEDDYNKYLGYQSLVRQQNEEVYLAKNNNFLLRYESLRSHNDSFLVFILIREPLAHAASLLEKHKQYSEMQADNEFVLDYMNWLGHHEFGLNQKAFNFGNEPPKGNKLALDYWLKIWINYYEQVSKIDDTNCHIVDYKAYCKNPEQAVNMVLMAADIEASTNKIQAFDNKRNTEAKYSIELYEQAKKLYLNLSSKHLT